MTHELHLLGQAFALGTAIMWGFAVVLFKISGERIPPIALNLFKNTVGLVLLATTLLVLHPLGMDGWTTVQQTPTGDICLLIASGIIGIAIADTLFFYALNLIGVGLIAVVECSYTPLVILFAWLLLSEQLTVFHYIGAALIVAGVFTATRHKLPPNRTRWQIVGGVLLSLLAVGLMAFGIVIAKPILEEWPLIWATTMRLGGGTVCLALAAFLGRHWQRNWLVFRPSTAWKTAVPASVLGTYICLILWIGGFKFTYAAVAAVLNQTSVVFQSVFAALIIHEHFGGRKITALVFALLGVLIVTSSAWLVAWTGW
jgi:drug/metabolite transporter (DMT)-like permease